MGLFCVSGSIGCSFNGEYGILNPAKQNGCTADFRMSVPFEQDFIRQEKIMSGFVRLGKIFNLNRRLDMRLVHFSSLVNY